MAPVVSVHTLPAARAVILARENLTLPVADRVDRLLNRSRLSRAEVARRMQVPPRLLTRLQEGGPALTRDRIKKLAVALRLREELFYPGARPDLFWARVDAELDRWRPQRMPG